MAWVILFREPFFLPLGCLTGPAGTACPCVLASDRRSSPSPLGLLRTTGGRGAAELVLCAAGEAMRAPLGHVCDDRHDAVVWDLNAVCEVTCGHLEHGYPGRRRVVESYPAPSARPPQH